MLSLSPPPTPPSLAPGAFALYCNQVYESSNGKEDADKVANYFGPAVEHLGKWMPLYLAPPLIVLPNALSEVSTRKTTPLTTHYVLTPFCACCIRLPRCLVRRQGEASPNTGSRRSHGQVLCIPLGGYG